MLFNFTSIGNRRVGTPMRIPLVGCVLLAAIQPSFAQKLLTTEPLILGIAPCFVELCEAVVAVNDVKRPSQFGQERDCWSPFRSERQARPAMPEVACKL